MKQKILYLYNGFNKTKTAIFLAVLALYMILTVYSGGSLFEIALFLLVITGYILLPGLLATQILPGISPEKGFRLPLAILCGTGFFAVLYCFSMRLGILWLLRLLPPLLSMGYLFWIGYTGQAKKWMTGRKSKPVQPVPHVWMLLLLYAALLLLYTFAGVIKNARPLAVGDVVLNQDILWNVGNANSFKLAFPPQDIRFYDVRLHYHYLTELLSGALSLVSGISAYNIIGFYLQPVMLVALVVCLYRFGQVIWPDNLFKRMFFAYSFFLFSCASLWKILPNGNSVFWNSNITHLITNVNSQATAIVYLCIFMGLFIGAARKKYKVSLVYYLVMTCAFVMLCFAKGPLAAMVTISLVVTLLIGLFQKKTSWQGLLFGVVVAGLFVFIYLTMFSSGANTSMPFKPAGTLEKGYFKNILERLFKENYPLWRISIPLLWLVQSFLMLPAQMPLFTRGLVHDLRYFGRIEPERMVSYGVVAGGIMAYFLFDHPSMSQVYFLFAAIFFLHLLVIGNLEYISWPKKENAKTKKAVFQKAGILCVAFFAAVGVCTTGFLYVHHIGSGSRQLARNLGFIEKYPYDAVVNTDDETGMLWLRDNSPTDAMFATNRIHTGARREGISNLYSAFCERQGYMEGFQYAVTNMGVSQPIVLERISVNERLFNPDTPPEEILELCRENGIDYLIYSSQFDGSAEGLNGLERVFDSATVQIFATGV